MITVSLAVQDQGLLDEVRSSLNGEAVTLNCEQIQVTDLSPFVEQLKRSDPDMIFIDVGSLLGPVSQAVQAIRLASPKSFLVALNTQAESKTLLDCFHAGANEYLVPPVGDGIRNVLHNRLAQAGRVHKATGKVIAFLSAKGGCGATTIACHTAVEIASLKSKVLLADLDIQNGMVGFLMGAKSAYSISDAFRNTERLDKSYWGALVSHSPSGLDIISAPTSVDAKREPAPEHVRRVLNYSRGCYEWTLLDLGRGLSPFTLFALEEADQLCLIVKPNIPALHQAKGIVQTLLDSGYAKDRIHVVLNCVSRRMEVDPVALSQVLSVPIFAGLKNQEAELAEAWASGGLLPSTADLARQIGQLARKLVGEQPAPKHRFSFFGRNKN